MTPEQLEAASASLYEMNAAMQNFTEVMGGAVKGSAASAAAANTQNTAGRTLTDMYIRGAAAKKLEEEAATKAREATERWTTVGANASNSVSAFGSALLTAGGGLTKYAAAVDASGKVFSDLAKSLPGKLAPLGFAVGLVVDSLFKLEKQALLYGDNLLKSKDELADFGAVGVFTSQAILNMAKDAQYTSVTLAGWTKATKSLGTDIIGLSTTVNGGVAEFAKLTAISREQLDNYQAMGISQEKVTQMQADYVGLLSKSGTVITENMKRDGSLKKATTDYITNLVQLSEITGLNRDQAKTLQEQATSQVSFQLKMMELSQKQMALDEQILTETDAGRKAELKSQSEAITVRVQQSKTLVTEATHFGAAQGAAVAKMIATEGAITEANQAPGMMMQDMTGAVKRTMEGVYVQGQATKDIVDTAGKNVTQYGSLTLVATEEIAKMLGLDNQKTLEIITTLLGKTKPEDSPTVVAAAAKKTAEDAAAGETAAKKQDDADKVRIGILNAELVAQNAMDSASQVMIKHTAEMVGLLSNEQKAIEAVTTAMLALAAVMGAAALFKGVTGVAKLLKRTPKLPVATPKFAPGQFAVPGLTGPAGPVSSLLPVATPKVAPGQFAVPGLTGPAGPVSSLSTRANVVSAGKWLGRGAGVASAGLAAYEGYEAYQGVNKDIAAGRLTSEEGTVKKSEAVGKAAGGVVGGAAGGWAGAAAGATAGAALGTVAGPLGIAVGGVVGAIVGGGVLGWLGSKGGELIGEKVGNAAGKALIDKPADIPTASKDTISASDRLTTALEKLRLVITNSVTSISGTTPDAANIARASFAATDPRRVDGNKPNAQAATAATAGSSQAARAGLRIKSDESTAGGLANEGLIDIASKIQNGLGSDLVSFTSLNDRFHMDRSSAHNKGNALDFTIADTKKSAEIADRIRGISGVGLVIDEYKKPSEGSTGGHIHVQLSGEGPAAPSATSVMASTAGGAAMGGAHVGRRSIASTSPVTSGWASEPKALGEVSTVENKAVSKTPDTSVITEKETTSKQITTTMAPAVATTSTPVADIQGMTAELINILTGKLDIVISRLDTSNDIQDQLLKYSRV